MEIMIEDDFDLFSVLEEKLLDLEKETFDYGMWDNTSAHYSGYSFPSLLKFLSEGSYKANIPPRPVLTVTDQFNPIESSPLKSQLSKYLNLNYKGKASEVGKITASWYATQAKGSFGDTSFLESNSRVTQYIKRSAGVVPADNPLVWTGSLRDHMQFKYGNMIEFAP